MLIDLRENEAQSRINIKSLAFVKNIETRGAFNIVKLTVLIININKNIYFYKIYIHLHVHVLRRNNFLLENKHFQLIFMHTILVFFILKTIEQSFLFISTVCGVDNSYKLRGSSRNTCAYNTALPVSICTLTKPQSSLNLASDTDVIGECMSTCSVKALSLSVKALTAKLL